MYTIKKKCIQYKSGLLIGLLSLNTLSSCVNTGRALAMGGVPSRDVEEGNNRNRDNKTSNFSKKQILSGIAGAAIFAAGSAGAGYAIGHSNGSLSGYNNGYNDGRSNGCLNGKLSTTTAPDLPRTWGGIDQPYNKKR